MTMPCWMLCHTTTSRTSARFRLSFVLYPLDFSLSTALIRIDARMLERANIHTHAGMRGCRSLRVGLFS
jgi:hypothetical protein